MEQRDDFYVTLCSNVVNENTENTIANFVTQLPAPLCLDASWRVGLSEIHYTNSWWNLRYDNHLVITTVFSDPGTIYSSEINLPAGRYFDIQSVISEINGLVRFAKQENVATPPTLSLNELTQRVCLRYGKSKKDQFLTLRLGQELSDLLGISAGWQSKNQQSIVNMNGTRIGQVSTYNIEEDEFEAKRSYDMAGGIHSLFVYSDCVDYSIVGDTKAQVLRMTHIPSDSRFGTSVVDRYENPHYLPLSTKEIHSIEIHIKDDCNETVRFEFGRVKAVLHFVRHG